MSRTLTNDNLDQIVYEYFQDALSQFNKSKLTPDQFENPDYIKRLEDHSRDYKMRSMTNLSHHPDSIGSLPSNLIALNIDPTTCEYVTAQELQRKIDLINSMFNDLEKLKAIGDMEEIDKRIESAKEKFKTEIKEPMPIITPAAQTQIQQLPIPEPTNTVTETKSDSSVNQADFNTVVEAYLKSLNGPQSSGSLSPTTIDDYRKKFEVYSGLLNNKNFNDITKQDVIDCQNWTFNTPKNLKKIALKSKYKSHWDVIKDTKHGYPLIAQTTTGKYLVQLRALLQYAYRNNYTESQLSDFLHFKQTKTPENRREPFTKDELLKIFNGYIYRDTETSRRVFYDYMFWVPLIGLFTGARINEICSLYLTDIIYDKELDSHFFSINDKESDKSVKTESSIRTVPIHETIIQSGFLDYISELKRSGKEKLFPSLSYRGKGGYGKDPSRWFSALEKRENVKSYSGYLSDVGVKTSKTKTQTKNFHCFRHTFIDNLKNHQALEVHKISDLVGHESGKSQTLQYGGKELSRKIKLESINHLDYGIDFSHISWHDFKTQRNPS